MTKTKMCERCHNDSEPSWLMTITYNGHRYLLCPECREAHTKELARIKKLK
jgi:hypothetical protein